MLYCLYLFKRIREDEFRADDNVFSNDNPINGMRKIKRKYVGILRSSLIVSIEILKLSNQQSRPRCITAKFSQFEWSGFFLLSLGTYRHWILSE